MRPLEPHEHFGQLINAIGALLWMAPLELRNPKLGPKRGLSSGRHRPGAFLAACNRCDRLIKTIPQVCPRNAHK